MISALNYLDKSVLINTSPIRSNEKETKLLDFYQKHYDLCSHLSICVRISKCKDV